MNLLQNNLFTNSLLVYVTNYDDLSPAQNVTNLLVKIDQQIDKDIQSSLFISVGMIVVVIISLVPVCLLLHKRFTLHEKVFDLMTSIDSEMAAKEIQSLNYVSNILKNYDDSHIIMKDNFMGYR